MRLKFDKRTDLLNVNGSVAGTFLGEYEAIASPTSEPGWYDFYEVDSNGIVGTQKVANVHIHGNIAT